MCNSFLEFGTEGLCIHMISYIELYRYYNPDFIVINI